MKTLLIKYLPSGANSNTRKLLDIFLAEHKNRDIEIVDLLTEEIPFFNQENIQSYYKKHYGKQVLSASEEKGLAGHYKLMNQFKGADVVVMAYPMHNFGMPGRVKSYLDAVIMNGETFEAGKKPMAGKKSLTLSTSGGIYSDDKFDLNYPNWNTLIMAAKINFTAMGFDEVEVLGTSLRDPEKSAQNLADMQQKIKAITTKWY